MERATKIAIYITSIVTPQYLFEWLGFSPIPIPSFCDLVLYIKNRIVSK